MRLRKKGKGSLVSGQEAMRIYRNHIAKKGYTRFDTDSEIGQDKREEYQAKISDGEKVLILFTVNDEVTYRAEVMRIVSSRNRSLCPEPNGQPPYFLKEGQYAARAWIKIRNLTPENAIKVKMLKLTKSGDDLQEMFAKQWQCRFYVSLK